MGRPFEEGELSEEKGGDTNEEQTIYEGTFEHYEQEEWETVSDKWICSTDARHDTMQEQKWEKELAGDKLAKRWQSQSRRESMIQQHRFKQNNNRELVPFLSSLKLFTIRYDTPKLSK